MTYLTAIFSVLIKFVLPAIVIFLMVRTLLRAYFLHRLQIVHAQQPKAAAEKKESLHFRLQAYERLSLLSERISIPNLILRLRDAKMESAALKNAMLLAIQQEYEHNISQQVYVSDQLWQLLQFARTDAVNIISAAAEEVAPQSNAQVLAEKIFEHLGARDVDVSEKVQSAIRKETQLLFQ